MPKRGLANDDIAKEKNDISGLWALLSYGQAYKKELTIFVLILCIASIVLIASSYILGLLIQEVSSLSPEDSITDVLYLAGLFVLVEIVAFVLKWRGSLGMIKTSINIVYDLRNQLFEKLSNLPMSYFDRQPMGRTITRATSDIQGIEALFSSSLFRMLRAGIQIVTVLGAMLLLAPKLGAFVVLSSVPAICLNLVVKKWSRKWMREIKVRGAKVNSKVAENLNGLSVIKAFGLEKWSQSKLNKLLDHHLEANNTLNNINSIIRPVTVVLSSLPSLITLVVGGKFVLNGQIELAVFIAYLRYTEMFLSPIRILSYEIQQIQNAFSSAERVKQLLIEETEEEMYADKGSYEGRISGHIEFKNLTLSYDGEVSALKNVNFKIDKSQKIGIVGRTGSGKTSAVSLLARLYPFQSGDILFDGVPISEFNRSKLRKQIGFVSQDAVIFRGTIRENLLCAVENPSSYTDNTILKEAKKTGLYDSVMKHPQGLDFELLDNGINLSQGEKQLINFTRILLRDPSILILDEATANTDEITEEKIHQAVDKVMENRTCIIIAHRIGTIKACDSIFVFEDGELVEKGPHDELLNNSKGFYSQLIHHQLTGVKAAVTP
ncbi:ABC transporter ATP-binding protein/permease [bacterium]|nr:ABC transporter ATP-binding protein/permease [bacterium]